MIEKLLAKLIYRRRPLLSHSFFSTSNRILTYDIYKLPIENQLKRKVVIHFLKVEFETLINTTKESCKNIETIEIDSFEQIIIDALKSAEDQCKKDGVPTVFLDKFRVWDENHIETLLSGIHQIIGSKFYATSYTKMIAIMDIMTSLLEIQILDVEKTINAMNGDLERALKGSVFDA